MSEHRGVDDFNLKKLMHPNVYNDHDSCLGMYTLFTMYTMTMILVQGWGKDRWEKGEYQVVLKRVGLPMVARAACQTMLRQTRLGR